MAEILILPNQSILINLIEYLFISNEILQKNSNIKKNAKFIYKSESQ